MREHATFIESALPASQKGLAARAGQFRKLFNGFLREAIHLAEGILTEEALSSGQFYTNYTLIAEQDFQKYFGIDISSELTKSEYRITPFKQGGVVDPQLRQVLSALNWRLSEQATLFIQFQLNLLSSRDNCDILILLYPSALDHLIREARMFEDELKYLQSDNEPDALDCVSFWNKGMAEHAKSLQGQLDWTEEDTIRDANAFAILYDEFAVSSFGREQALEHTPEFGMFAQIITRNVLGCRLKGIITALYADHLLREINHFDYLLRLQL
jgi:hypothetical protein